MSEMQKSDFKEININKLLITYLKNIWLIGICAFIGFTAVATYLAGFYPDMYTASATMYVYISNPNQVNYQYTSSSDLNTATRLMETYMVVIKSNKVMDAVAERLGSGYSANFIANSIYVSSVSDTEVMRVSATTTDAKLSMDICNAVAEFAPAEIIRVVNAGAVEVIDYASLPKYPNAKNLFSKSALGALLGVALVCGVLTLMVLRDHRIETENDLVDNYEIPLLITVPDLNRRFFSGTGKYGRYGKYGYAYGDKRLSGEKHRKKREKGNCLPDEGKVEEKRFIITEETAPAIVEVYKMFRTNVSFAMGESDNNVLTITSAIPSEGKSTVSANLSIVAAQDNKRVLLIDGDMRKPRQAEQFGVDNSHIGLSTVLMNIDEFDHAVIRDVRPNLDLLPAGIIPPNPSELLNSDRAKQLIMRLRTIYDLIIIDTPPVNVVADSMVLSDQVAGAIFVVRYHVSNTRDLDAAIKAVGFVNMKVLGFALTDVRRKGNGRHYHKYKYYKKYNTGYYNAYSYSYGQKNEKFRSGEEITDLSDHGKRTI